MNSFNCIDRLDVGDRTYTIQSLPAFAKAAGINLDAMPFVTRVLLENLLRNEDGETVQAADIASFARTYADAKEQEVAFYPTRILMPDSSGLPLLADLAALRDAVKDAGIDPRRINPLIPVDLVIDHSASVDYAGSQQAFEWNLAAEFERNQERYAFVRWAEGQIDNLRVIPPGNGILHQINVEYLASVVTTRTVDGVQWAFPDTLVGMDSHTPMVNGVGVFGWGVGGIEAATAMLGEPLGLLPPSVTGCRLTGMLRPGIMAADVALTLTQRLRAAGVLGGWVEFFGPGLDTLPVTERVSIANMAPEYGATMGFFPIDARTLEFLRHTGRSDEQVALVEAYAHRQSLFHDQGNPPSYGQIIEFDLSTVEPVLAGPNRPEQRMPLSALPKSFQTAHPGAVKAHDGSILADGDIVIASITSCTNTSNPRQMIAAGLLARNAVAKGLKKRSTVKTSLSPGSRAIGAMLQEGGLMEPLAELGFDITGYGCMSCVGNAGPLPEAITDAVDARGLVVCGVLSSNRNFEGRLHPSVKATYLASPPLIVALAIAGTVLVDLDSEPLGRSPSGEFVFLRDVWPSDEEIAELAAIVLKPTLFSSRYKRLADGGKGWQSLPQGTRPVFGWDSASLYLKRPPFLENLSAEPGEVADIKGAYALLMLGDDITTDHISPGGNIPSDTSAGHYLTDHGVRQADFNSYIARRGNHHVMERATFANIRLRNEMATNQTGGWTRHVPSGVGMTVFDASQAYQKQGQPLLVIAGKNYGCGSSRDWAAKGTQLLGIKAVIAESFERIHRSNLVGMGILPLEFESGTTRKTLALTGAEQFDILGLEGLKPKMTITLRIHRPGGECEDIKLLCRVDTPREVKWVEHGGILPYVARALIQTGETQAA